MPNRPIAPELSPELEWVNTQGPLTLQAYRGKVVLLYFWGISQVNSQHALLDVRYLENKYDDGLVVLGFSCPKFTAERSSARLLKAVNRNFIRHPVANDVNFDTWQRFSINAWPTMVLLDAEGQIADVISGEGKRAQLDEQVGRLLDEAAERDLRVYDATNQVARPEPRYSLRFPSKVLATRDHLYISDTGNNRILECNHEGRVMRVFGSGNAGFWDGAKNECGFREPRGMAVLGEFLYVADTGNHAIRRIRLHNGDVDTIAGTGELGRREGTHLSDPKTVPLASPWDLVGQADRLYIALAGQHQICQLDLSRSQLGTFAGTGRMDRADGDAADAAFAQPMGLCLTARNLFVADSECSSIRSIRMADHKVSTLVGADCYRFGERDGAFAQAELQHPRALAADDSGTVLWIADSYNDKIRMLDLRTQSVSTLNLGFAFSEPSGLSRIGEKLFVADTNAHHVVEIDLRSGRVEPVAVVD